MQLVNYCSKYGTGIRPRAARDAIKVYRDFRVLPYGEDEKRPNGSGKYRWWLERLKFLSDQIMEFSEEDAWRERINKQNKMGKFVRNEEADQEEDQGDHQGDD